jgi:FkbM family methyltransferase
MRKYSITRWILSQTAAFFLGSRRFISLSVPSARQHKVFDREKKEIIHIQGRGEEDAVSIIQIFIAEFYRLTQLGARYEDLIENYRHILESGKQPIILDCGANIGLTSLYFSRQFPQAKVVSIEPDKLNCDFATANTKKNNVDVIRAAVGSEAGKCDIADTSVDSNSYQISVQAEGRGDVVLLTINQILTDYGDTYTPFIIKIDVEGFENQIFQKNTEWVPLFYLMIVELHDWMLPKEANALNFLKVVSAENRDFHFYNENVFSIRNQ